MRGVPSSLRPQIRTVRNALLLTLATLFACGGESRQPETNAELCDRAASYVQSCGTTSYPVDCTYLTPDRACDNRCDLAASCGYFQGTSPSENRSVAQCGSRCTCESAQRRANDCGIAITFTCDDICNCAYSNDCAAGITAYANCRAECPPWPD